MTHAPRDLYARADLLAAIRAAVQESKTCRHLPEALVREARPAEGSDYWRRPWLRTEVVLEAQWRADGSYCHCINAQAHRQIW